VDEVLESYKAISAPTLCVEAQDNSLEQWWQGRYTLQEYNERLASVPQLQRGFVADAGHMLHHDQPGQLAQLVEKFLNTQ
jgi:pimeloyl-ACP methyl ester carboxylesterase